MPKFTIVTNVGEGPEVSDEPLDFPDQKSATDDAQVALADMARERLPSCKTANLAVRISDETGKEVYAAVLQFAAKTEDDMRREANEAAAAADEIAALLAGSPRR